MTSFYHDGDNISYEGFRGTITKITETYRKNVLVVKVTKYPRNFIVAPILIGLFEYPDGKLEFSHVIE